MIVSIKKEILIQETRCLKRVYLNYFKYCKHYLINNLSGLSLRSEF